MNRLLLIVIALAATVALGLAGFAYWRGFERGVQQAWTEFNEPYVINGAQYATIGLYEGGKPCSVLFIEKDVTNGDKRHMTVRKVGCGAHWNLQADAEFDSTTGICFSSKADITADLWRQK